MLTMGYLIRYINYLQQAKNKFDIHPPFLYDLVSNVIDDKTRYPEYEKIEQLKRELLKNHETIEVTDLGAGSKADSNHTRTVKSITRHSSKPDKFGRLMHRLARFLEPPIILELGTAMGLSTAYLALGNARSAVTTVEGCPNISGQARKNLDSLDLQRVKVINGNFDDVLPRYLETVPQVDLVFFDGNHRKDPTINYFEQCLLKTVNTSCFIFDDIHWSEGMESAWKHISQHPSVTLSLDLFFSGIVFFRKELSKQHFVIRF